MAATELATAYVSLVPSLKGAGGNIAKELGGIDTGGAGKAMGKNLGGGIMGSLKGMVGPASAIMAGIGIGNFVADSFQALQGIEVLNAQTANVIKSTGGAAGVSATFVQDLALSLEGLTATEAQAIQQGANTLLTFTNIKNAAGEGNDIFTQATGVMTDYSRAMGIDAGAAAIQLGKALNDPTKGVSALGKAGVQFTAQQKEQIKTMQASGDMLGAQKIILKELETQFGGSGAAYAQTTAGKIDLLKDSYGDLGETLVSSFMPALGDAASAGTVLFNGLQPIAEKAGTAAAALTSGLIAQGPRVKAGLDGIRAIIMEGDFTGAMTTAFGVQEDSPVVGALFTIRETVVSVFGGISDFMAGFTLPTDWADAAPLTGFVAVGSTVRGIFDGIIAAVGPLIPSFMELYSSLSPVSLIFQAIQPFLPLLLDTFLQLATVVGGALMGALAGVLPSLMTLADVAVNLFQGVLATALPLIVQLVTMLGATFAQLMPVLVPIIAQVVTLAAALISQLAPIFMQLVSTVMPMVVVAVGAILSAVVPLISTIASVLIPVISALMPIVVTVFSVIQSVISNVMQIIMGVIQVVTGIISGNWAQVFSGMLNIVSGVFGLVLSVISGAIRLVISVVGNGLNAVLGFFTSIFSNVVNYVSTSFASIVNGAGRMLGDLLGFFGGLGGKILGALGNIGSTLFNAGKNIVQGLIDGIGSMMGAIGRAVINIVPEAIRGPFEQMMGIRSPSRVAIYWGHMIGQGAIDGLEDMYDPVAEATALLVQPPALPSFATSGARAAYSAGAGAPATGYSGPLVHQEVHPSERMSEENLAEISARKIVGALT